MSWKNLPSWLKRGLKMLVVFVIIVIPLIPLTSVLFVEMIFGIIIIFVIWVIISFMIIKSRKPKSNKDTGQNKIKKRIK